MPNASQTPKIFCLQADQIQSTQTSINKSCTIPHYFSFTIEYISGHFSTFASDSCLQVELRSDHNGYADATPTQSYLFYPTKTPVSLQPNMVVQRLSERVWIPIGAQLSGILDLVVTRYAATSLPPGSSTLWTANLEVHGYLTDLTK